MAAIAAYLQKAGLDWALGGATPTRPTAWGVSLSLGAPTSVSGSEITTGSGYARQTVGFAPAVLSAGSASNTVAMTFGPFSSGASISGVALWDTVLSANSGNMLAYGLLATPRTVGAGDSLVIASGALVITLA